MEKIVPVDEGAEAFIELIVANGVEYLFLNPGTDTFPIQEALSKFKALGKRTPKTILCLDESVAMAAAHGYFAVTGRPQVVLDVAHNPQAAAVLAANLGESGFSPQTIAVLGMLKDKDIAGVVRAVAPRITRWHLATLPGPRGASAGLLSGIFSELKIQSRATRHHSVPEALAAARREAGENDKIVVFGSFLTVADAYG